MDQTRHGDHSDYNKHAGHKTSSFLTKFWIALVATIPIFFYSDMAVMLFNIQAPQFLGSRYIWLVVGSFIFWYCGWVFIASAYRELRAKLPGMMTLIAIAISAAYFFSVFVILSGREGDLLFELSSLITIMLLGHWIEMKSVQGAQGALKELAKLLPDQAEVMRGDKTEIIPLSALRVGDIVLVKPGANVPADGRITAGTSELNESVITGESRPVEKTVGSVLIAGSINGDGSLKVVIEKIGEQTFLAGVMRLVANAQASKSRLQMLSDRAALYLTIIALVAGSITFITWLFVGAGMVTATERLVAVLVIACPHALGLAVPLVAAISTAMAARNGLLVKERRALEAARSIDTILFDKTGTLTKGEFGIVGTVEDQLLQLAASVNAHSEHPLAKAIVKSAQQKNLTLLPVQDFSRVAGKGVTGKVDGKVVQVGNFGTETTGQVAGHTVVQVVVDGTVLGSIALADVIREESRQAIQTLHQLGIKTAMITGDSEDVAAWVAQELHIDKYFARVMPDQKSAKVKLLQSQSRKVAMVGDGVNDAPALTQADLGIAIGAGTNVAIESAGIILVRNDPRDIPKIIRLSDLTYHKMIQNLFWATGYNVVAIPLAAGVLAVQGIILEPAIAAVFMSVSTVIVAFNAVLLRKKQYNVEKMKISLAQKNLFHEPARLVISVSGVTFAVFLILLLLALYRGWSETLSEYIYKVDVDIWVMQAGTVDMSHSVSLLPNTTLDQLHTITGVDTVTSLVGNRSTLNVADQEVTSRIIGVNTEKPIGGPTTIVSGTKIIRNGEIVIDQIIQQDEDLSLGQTVTIQNQSFTIVGVASGGPLFQQSYVTMTNARELFHLQEYSNYFVVSVSDSSNVNTVIQEIEDTIPGIDAQTTEEFATNNEKEIMESFLPIIYVLVFIGFIVGVVIISLTIYTATIEKIREYGVLKAIGASNRYLYQVVLTQSGITGGLGLCMGIVLTYGVSLNIQRFEPLFVTLVKWQDVMGVAGLTGVMVICAAYIPVRRILSIDPAIVFKA